MNRWLTVFSSAVAGLLLAGAPARADFVQWSYDWTPGQVVVQADGNGTGGISFKNEPATLATGSSDIVATNLHAISSATPSNPDTLINNGAYSLSLAITDIASGKTGTVTFTGKLSGTFSATSSNVTNVFTSPSTEVLTLGQNVYTIVIGQYSPPGPPTAGNAGAISAHVTVSSLSIQSTTPEPSSLIMAGLALTMGGGAAWRKRRNSLAAQLA
jgi:PEP-CTERM motif